MTTFKVEPDGDLWRVISDTGEVAASGLTNSQAWRKADILSNESVSASEAKKETLQGASLEEQRDAYLSLIGEASLRGYNSGWVAHTFHRRFAKWPWQVPGLTVKEPQ